MPDWYEEPLVCTNCGAVIGEYEIYLRYEDGKNDLTLCQSCLEEHTH